MIKINRFLGLDFLNSHNETPALAQVGFPSLQQQEEAGEEESPLSTSLWFAVPKKRTTRSKKRKRMVYNIQISLFSCTVLLIHIYIYITRPENI